MVQLPSRYPSSPPIYIWKLSDRTKAKMNWTQREKRQGTKTNGYITPPPPHPAPESASAPPPYHHSFGRELSDFCCRQQVHHLLITLFHRKQHRDLHMSASACFPARRLSHRLPQYLLLVSPPAAVAEQVFPRLGRHSASATAPWVFVVLSVPKPF